MLFVRASFVFMSLISVCCVFICALVFLCSVRCFGVLSVYFLRRRFVRVRCVVYLFAIGLVSLEYLRFLYIPLVSVGWVVFVCVVRY